jgi:nitroimidazol reductase NimA-like FMN-containing flavoprotein (pyridoxamine 5'-phosphate oxidase superfamily)
MTAEGTLAEKLPSNADHAARTPWPEALRRLAEGEWYWLATAGRDGAPHVRPVLAVWHDRALYFVSHPASRKARILAGNRRCALTVAVEDAHLVVEGTASRVTDDALLRAVAAVYDDKYQWRVTVRDGVFHADYGAPTAGPPPFDLYALTPERAYAFGTHERFSPTRYLF